MVKKLAKTRKLVMVDRPLLERTGIDENPPLEISSDGDAFVVSPARKPRARGIVEKAMEEIHKLYGGAFRRLAE